MRKSWYSRVFRNVALCGVIVLASFSVLSCAQDPEEETLVVEYDKAIAIVDYSGKNQAVFFDFSTGKTTELSHDFFDIAMCADGSIIANSGSYGSGVWVYNTNDADITKDFASSEAAVKEYTFRDGTSLYGYQTVANPLEDLAVNAESKVYLIKVQYGATPEYFKATFKMAMGAPPIVPSFTMTVVPGLGAGETAKKELSASPITGIAGPAGFGYFYFKLVGTGGPRLLNAATSLNEGAPAIPLAVEWDILCTRTNELQSTDGSTIEEEMPVVSRSSILLNTYKKVTVAKVEGKDMSEVLTVPEESAFSGEIDAINYSWYGMAGMPPTFSVAKNTYVVKTVEETYAKFQPTTFYGPSGESFYMSFQYLYQEDGATTFSK
ncbi:MAG: HmuY family protein [Treponema sp.]|jgi:hypothetical protein|nr:HmuY family protein [Treponema sp.]